MNHLMKYLAHYAGVAAGLCTIIAGLDPKALPPQLAPVIGAAATGVIIAHALGIKPLTIAKAASVLLLTVLLIPGLNGCATVSRVSTIGTSPAAQPYIQAAALAAVSTAEQKGVSAAEITAIATQALAADQGASATLAGVAAVVNQQLAKLNLPAGDIQAAQILEVSINVAITAQIGSNATLAQAQAAVADILNAIIAAANPGGAPATGTSTTSDVAVPAPPSSPVLSSIESPPVVGASLSTLLVASLQAFGHVSIGGPAAAALTVVFTLGAAYLQL